MNLVFVNINYLFMFVMTVVASTYYKKTKGTPLRYFVYLLWFMFLSDAVVARLLRHFGYYNVWWYNIIVNIETLFYLILFYHYIKRPVSKTVILVATVVYELYYLISFLLLSETWNDWQAFPFALGSFFVVLSVFIFLIEFFNTDKVLYLKDYLIFWIAIGVLFYLVVAMPLTIVQNYMRDVDYHGSSSLLYIQYIANMFMYLSFIIGFIWSKK